MYAVDVCSITRMWQSCQSPRHCCCCLVEINFTLSRSLTNLFWYLNQMHSYQKPFLYWAASHQFGQNTFTFMVSCLFSSVSHENKEMSVYLPCLSIKTLNNQSTPPPHQNYKVHLEVYASIEGRLVVRLDLAFIFPPLHLFAHFWISQELCGVRQCQDGNSWSHRTELHRPDRWPHGEHIHVFIGYSLWHECRN